MLNFRNAESAPPVVRAGWFPGVTTSIQARAIAQALANKPDMHDAANN